MLSLSVACIGYIILLTVYSVPVLVFATCLVTAGLYPSVILLATWLGINTADFTKRGTIWAMAEIFGTVFRHPGHPCLYESSTFRQGPFDSAGVSAFRHHLCHHAYGIYEISEQAQRGRSATISVPRRTTSTYGAELGRGRRRSPGISLHPLSLPRLRASIWKVPYSLPLALSQG